jgi:hypothetical protein
MGVCYKAVIQSVLLYVAFIQSVLLDVARKPGSVATRNWWEV